jgi:hypothetical protein
MDFDLSEDQTVLLSALDSILDPYRDIAVADRNSFAVYATGLDAELAENGFLDAAKTDGMGPLDAALIVEAIARLPQVVESAASALVAPMLGLDLPRPFALLSGPLSKAQRFLTHARTALFDTGDDLLAFAIDPAAVEPVTTIFAYPYGRFTTLPDLTQARSLGAEAAAKYRTWARIALAAEMAGAARAAVDFTVGYVKDRRMFGRQLGTYQVVHHRLAECDQIARAAYWLTMKAAWSGTEWDAAAAAAYIQQHVKKLMFDLHQFNGAMGLTTEHLLHYFTFRVRALQSEMGGQNGAALALADAQWGPA